MTRPERQALGRARDILYDWGVRGRDSKAPSELAKCCDVDTLTIMAWLVPPSPDALDTLLLLDRAAEHGGRPLSRVRRSLFEIRTADDLSPRELARVEQVLGEAPRGTLDHLLALDELARMSEASGQHEEAEEWERALGQESRTAGQLVFEMLSKLHRARRLRKAGDVQSSASVHDELDSLLEADAEARFIMRPFIQFERAWLMDERGDPGALRAFVALQREQGLPPALEDQAMSRAADLMESRAYRTAAAATHMRRVERMSLRLSPQERAESLFAAGRNFARRGQASLALSCLRNARSELESAQAPGAPTLEADILGLESCLLVDRGLLIPARRALEKARSRAGSSRSPWIAQAECRIYEAEGRFERAEEKAAVYLKSLKRSDPTPDETARLAVMRVRFLREADAHSPLLPEALHQAHLLASLAGDIETLEEAFQLNNWWLAQSSSSSELAVQAVIQTGRVARRVLNALHEDRRLTEELEVETAPEVVEALLGTWETHDRRSQAASESVARELALQLAREQKKGRRLETRNRRLERVFEEHPIVLWSSMGRADGFALRSIEGRIRMIMGGDAEEFLEAGSEWVQCIHPDDRGAFLQTMQVVEENLEGRSITLRMSGGAGDKNHILARVMPLLGESHEEGMLYGTFFDVDQRSESEILRAVEADASARQTLLIVDDDERIRRVLTRQLAKEPFQAVTASSAEEALSILENADPSPAMIITDVRMPGLNGLEFLREIRARSAKIPVMIVTGFADLEVEEAASLDSHVVLLEKPFTRSRLLETLNALLRDTTSPGEPPPR